MVDIEDQCAIPQILAVSSYQRGCYLDAILYSLRSLASSPNNVLSIYVLGRSYLAAHMFEESKRSLRRVLELDPDFAVVQDLLKWLLNYLSLPERERSQILDTPGTPCTAIHRLGTHPEKITIQ